MPLSPYQRIVEEIRRRIADGELSPGDRAPSARQIRDEWGVALATATKALTALRQEGLVITRPRAATIVAAPQRRPGRAGAAASTQRPSTDPAATLTRDRVIDAAIVIADAEGLDAVSMRSVAARLAVAPMSLYGHVPSKADLVLLMADTAFGELGYPQRPPAGWRGQLELGLRTLWALFRRHPWLAQVSPLVRPLPLPNLIAHSEWAFRALDGLGLDAPTMRNIVLHGYNYVQGIASNLEREAQAEATTGLSETQWVRSQQSAVAAVAASGRYPLFTRVERDLADRGDRLELDDLFEFGLAPLLDGWDALIGRLSFSAR